MSIGRGHNTRLTDRGPRGFTVSASPLAQLWFPESIGPVAVGLRQRCEEKDDVELAAPTLSGDLLEMPAEDG